MNMITQQIQQVANQYARLFNRQGYDFNAIDEQSKGIEDFYKDSYAFIRMLQATQQDTYTITFTCNNNKDLIKLKSSLISLELVDEFEAIDSAITMDSLPFTNLTVTLTGNLHDWLFTNSQSNDLNFYGLAKLLGISYRFKVEKATDRHQRFVLFGGADHLGYDEIVLSMKVKEVKHAHDTYLFTTDLATLCTLIRSHDYTQYIHLSIAFD